MKVSYNDKTGEMTVTAKVEPEVSGSGKSILLVSSHGTLNTGLKYKHTDGKEHEVQANINLTIKNPNAPTAG